MARSPEGKLPEIHVEDNDNNKSLSSGNGSDSEEEVKKTRKIKLNPRVTQERRDSGSSIGEEEESVVEISDEQRDKIIQQAEFYFSDENLKRDGFLLKHVKRNKEGLVNLKLLASFKKMKSLSRDYKVIREALKNSNKLVVNETGLKVRRVDPLPKDLIDQIKVKHVVVSKISLENPSMNFITDAFPKHKDDVVSVRIVKPGKKFPNDLQSHFSRHPELREEVVAVVEFENPDVAGEAMKSTFGGVYKGLEVRLLELGPKQIKRKENGETASDTPADSDTASPAVKRVEKNKKKKNRLLEVSGQEDSSYASSSDGEFSSFSSCSKRYNRSRGSSPATSPTPTRRFDSNNNSRNNSPKTTPNQSPKFQKKNQATPESNTNKNQYKLSPLVQESPHSSPDIKRKNKKNNSKATIEPTNATNGHSPWMTRRLQKAEELGNRLTESVTAGNNRYLDIIRQPKGPDGSIGFSNHPLRKFILVHAH